MKEKLCNLLKILIQILYFILLIIGYFYILDKFQFRTWLVLEPNIFYNNFFKSILIIFLIERVAYVISVIFHELGHLIFGIKANLKFKKFTIFMLSISYNDNKIKFQLKKNKSDLLGACFMSFEKDRLYNKSEIILCFIGGIVFNLLLLFGFIILLCIIPIYRKEHSKKVSNKKTDWGIVLTFAIGIVGSLIMGFGMSKVMVGSPQKMDIIIGMITGVMGLLICVLNYPIYSYLKSNK